MEKKIIVYLHSLGEMWINGRILFTTTFENEPNVVEFLEEVKKDGSGCFYEKVYAVPNGCKITAVKSEVII